MDLLRLGLERGHSAEKAVEIIIVMLEKYGQWGSAVRGADHDTGSYDNSFLIADAKEAWVLETSGRRWAAERIDSGERSISNEPTIRTGWTKASADLCDFAAHQGWWQPQAGDFDFAYAYGDHVHYSRQVSHIRWQQTSQLLKQNRGRLTATTFMRFLRDHYEDTFLKGPQFHPYLPDFLTVCMHDSPNKFTWGNTATSVVAELDPSGKRPLVFWTAYLPPCTSIYTAFSVSSTLPHEVTKVGTTGVQVHQPLTAPVDGYERGSLWWRLHRIVEETAKRPAARAPHVRRLFDPLESDHMQTITELLNSTSEKDFEPNWNRLIKDHIEQIMTAVGHLEHEWQLE
jgi:secernin